MKKIMNEGTGKLSVGKVEGDVEVIVPTKELLEAYKKQNPEKYATKKANGEFDKIK